MNQKKQNFTNAAVKLNKQVKRKLDAITPNTAQSILDLLTQEQNLQTTPNKTPEVFKQLQQIHNQLKSFTEINELNKRFGRKELIARMNKAMDLTNTAPKDISFMELVTNPDLQHISGNFSTFDAELSALAKQNINPDILRKKLSERLTNIPTVAQSFTKLWTDVLNKNPGSMRQMRDHCISLDLDSCTKYMQKFTNDMLKKQNIQNAKLNVKVIDSWAQAAKEAIKPHDTTDLIGLYVPSFSPGKPDVAYIHRKKTLNLLPSNMRNDISLFVNMMNILAHEYSHFIDYTSPDKGAVGAQKMTIGKKIYQNPVKTRHKEYMANPTEKSAYETGNTVAYQILKTFDKA